MQFSTEFIFFNFWVPLLVQLLRIQAFPSFPIQHEQQYGPLWIMRPTWEIWMVVCNMCCFIFLSAAAAFAGMMYLFVRQKYFVGYLGERTQR